MFNLFPKKNSVDEIIEDANLTPSWEWTPTQTPSMLQAQNELIEQFLKENYDLKLENKNLEDILKSIEEDGTKEHNNAIELRQENAKLKKDFEDQKQLKESLQRVNEKYIKKITEQQDFLSDLAKEVKNLRHLKTENVELIERIKNLEEDPFTNNWGSLYESAYKERDEYKHQLNAAIKEIEKLKESNFTQRNQWYGVCEYIINHAELKNHGVVVANACLRFLKERDELKAEVEKLKKESQKHPMYPLHWGGYDGVASAYPKQYSDWLNEQRDKTNMEKYDKNIIDFVNSEFSNEDPLEGEQVKEAVEELKNMKTQGFEDYDPSDFEQPVKEVEFNAEELLKRVTEYADTLNDLPKSFPDEFQDNKTTAENLEERFDEGKDVLNYFEKPWKCPCNKCKEAKTEKKPWDILKSLGSVLVTNAKTEKSWEEAASDLALKVAKLEKQIEELKVVKANSDLNLDSNYEHFKKYGKWPWQWNEAESLNEKLYD
jgi:DNA repair exonuclease SbcCD ATPase subunit